MCLCVSCLRQRRQLLNYKLKLKIGFTRLLGSVYLSPFFLAVFCSFSFILMLSPLHCCSLHMCMRVSVFPSLYKFDSCLLRLSFSCDRSNTTLLLSLLRSINRTYGIAKAIHIPTQMHFRLQGTCVRKTNTIAGYCIGTLTRSVSEVYMNILCLPSRIGFDYRIRDTMCDRTNKKRRCANARKRQKCLKEYMHAPSKERNKNVAKKIFGSHKHIHIHE